MKGKFTLFESCAYGKRSQAGYLTDDVNKLVLNRDNYASDSEYNAAVGDAIALLLRGGNEIAVKNEENLTILEYSHDNSKEYYGGVTLYWLDEDEADQIDYGRQERVQKLIAALEDANNTNKDSNE